MSMSLTVSQPTKVEFGNRYTHEFNPRISLHKSRFSPKLRAASTASPVSSLRVSATPDETKMTTPHPHRGLPPPSAMTLPDPSRTGPPPPLSQQLGAIPEPPRQWQGQEDHMRNWLAAKAEEDKRKQEEEKTRQESLRLEQRKIEQAMLRESLQGGVPPSMVPIIYAGIGGGQHLVNVSMDWLQQYASQLQVAQQQQLQQASPDMPRDGRLIGAPPPPPPLPYAVAPPSQPQMLPSQATAEPQPPGPIHTTFSAYQPSPARGQNTSAPRSATHTQLPRLTTNEMYVHQPPQPGPGSAHPLQQSQTIQQEQPSSSPSIYFHHWVPPSESKNLNMPQTPASRGEPSSAHPGSNIQEGDYRDSPRKRKAQGGHQANPPPSAGPQYTSPSFSTTSSTSRKGGPGHARTRSNASATRESDSRPDTGSSVGVRQNHLPPPASQKSDNNGNGNGLGEDPQRPASRAGELAEETTRPTSPASTRQESHPDQPRPGSR
ncbi:hypothetical protein AC579_8264 [Pseudocercospora musae]|uniref:Uncharacterized protein n=1 Tax=Pseudocercospora musae TaxID=113226 RepID=A0A139IVU6_9PEZI|nr:hypothetical protein AC579_8264 [Pseudocercospora musae]